MTYKFFIFLHKFHDLTSQIFHKLSKIETQNMSKFVNHQNRSWLFKHVLALWDPWYLAILRSDGSRQKFNFCSNLINVFDTFASNLNEYQRLFKSKAIHTLVNFCVWVFIIHAFISSSYVNTVIHFAITHLKIQLNLLN